MRGGAGACAWSASFGLGFKAQIAGLLVFRYDELLRGGDVAC